MDAMNDNFKYLVRSLGISNGVNMDASTPNATKSKLQKLESTKRKMEADIQFLKGQKDDSTEDMEDYNEAKKRHRMIRKEIMDLEKEEED